jgi:hypothetical protein
MAVRFTKLKQDDYLERIRNGVMRGPASDEIGVDRSTIRRYIEGHAGFRQKVEDAETDAAEMVQEAVFQAASSGSIPAAKLWLEFRGLMPQGGKSEKAVKDEPAQPEDPFGSLDNVTPISRRR